MSQKKNLSPAGATPAEARPDGGGEPAARARLQPAPNDAPPGFIAIIMIMIMRI